MSAGNKCPSNAMTKNYSYAANKRPMLRRHGACCLVWPDKLPTGADFVAGSYMPETIDTYSVGCWSGRMNYTAAGRCVFSSTVLNGAFRVSPLEVPFPSGSSCAPAGRSV